MLKRSFFERDPVTCARELDRLQTHFGDFGGIVVETEAYDAEGDEASHTAFRPSARAFVASHPAGAAYVYFSYGVHWMLNVLVKGSRRGFVLIRALEPVEGIEQMKKEKGTAGSDAIVLRTGKADEGVGHVREAPRQGFMLGSTLRIFRGRRNSKTGVLRAHWDLAVNGFAVEILCSRQPHVSRAPRKQGRAGVEPARLLK